MMITGFTVSFDSSPEVVKELCGAASVVIGDGEDTFYEYPLRFCRVKIGGPENSINNPIPVPILWRKNLTITLRLDKSFPREVMVNGSLGFTCEP